MLFFRKSKEAAYKLKIPKISYKIYTRIKMILGFWKRK